MARDVIEALGDQIPSNLRTPEELGRAVSVSNEGDIIRISARTGSPEASALIANTWSDIYARRLNITFADNALPEDALLTQGESLKQDYDAKEAALVAFLASSPWERLIRERDFILRQLNEQVIIKTKLIRLRGDAESLRELVQQGSGDVASSQRFAKLVVEANAFNNGQDENFRLDMPFAQDTDGRSRAELVAELDALINTLQQREDELAGPNTEALYAELNTKHTQIEQVEAKSKEFMAERDLAWNTYQLLKSKVAETSLATETESQFVRPGAEAVVPREPVDERVLLKTLLGGMAGAVVGAALALVLRPR
jgi:hypothetical protein